jgi:hypothetical protein
MTNERDPTAQESAVTDITISHFTNESHIKAAEAPKQPMLLKSFLCVCDVICPRLISCCANQLVGKIVRKMTI